MTQESNKEIIAWLLDDDAAIQYQVHRDLLGRERKDLRKRLAGNEIFWNVLEDKDDVRQNYLPPHERTQCLNAPLFPRIISAPKWGMTIPNFLQLPNKTDVNLVK